MIDDILRREGGFVDHPADRGGPTRFGITLRTLHGWRGAPVTRDDVRRLTETDARAIYRANYFEGPKIDQLPALLQPIVFDMGINHGPRTAIKLLQQVLGSAGDAWRCAIDGDLGPQTLAAAGQACSALGKTLVNALVQRRRQLYQDIVARDASQQVFLAGWLRRAGEFEQA